MLPVWNTVAALSMRLATPSDFEADAIRRVFGTTASFKKALNLAGVKLRLNSSTKWKSPLLFCG
jgi:hypothetical protein